MKHLTDRPMAPLVPHSIHVSPALASLWNRPGFWFGGRGRWGGLPDGVGGPAEGGLRSADDLLGDGHAGGARGGRRVADVQRPHAPASGAIPNWGKLLRLFLILVMWTASVLDWGLAHSRLVTVVEIGDLEAGSGKKQGEGWSLFHSGRRSRR